MPHLFETILIGVEGTMENHIFHQFFNRRVVFTQHGMEASSCHSWGSVFLVTKPERLVLKSGKRLTRASIDMEVNTSRRKSLRGVANVMARFNEVRGRNELASDLSARRVRLDTKPLIDREAKVTKSGVDKVTTGARGEDIERPGGDTGSIRSYRIE